MRSTRIKAAVPVRKHYAVWYGPICDDIFDCPLDERDPAQICDGASS